MATEPTSLTSYEDLFKFIEEAVEKVNDLYNYPKHSLEYVWNEIYLRLPEKYRKLYNGFDELALDTLKCIVALHPTAYFWNMDSVMFIEEGNLLKPQIIGIDDLPYYVEDIPVLITDLFSGRLFKVFI